LLIATILLMHSRRELADGFRALGVAAGDTVMVHASVRAVGAVAGGPDQIHLALKEVLSPEGTLIMYAGCPAYVDEVGRGHLTPDQERELLEKLPAFDPFTARAQRENGTLVEFLRTYPGSAVNQHVTRLLCGEDAPATSSRTNRGITPSALGQSSIGSRTSMARFCCLGAITTT
jgi:aminoglycoside 3-N-acetyltransferase